MITIEELQSQIDITSKNVETLTAERKYLDAEKEDKRLTELRKQFSEAKKHQIALFKKEGEEELKKALSIMTEKFNKEWDDELRNFEENAVVQANDLKAQHEKEVLELEERLLNEDIPLPKPSPELLKLRGSEIQLGKLKKFQEAQKAKDSGDELEKQEVANFYNEETRRKDGLRTQLKQRHVSEINALSSRIETERTEKSVQRKDDFSRLDQRFHNLVEQHRKEVRAQESQFVLEENARRGQESAFHITGLSTQPFSPTATMRAAMGNTATSTLASTSSGTAATPSSPSSTASSSCASTSAFSSSSSSYSFSSPVFSSSFAAGSRASPKVRTRPLSSKNNSNCTHRNSGGGGSRSGSGGGSGNRNVGSNGSSSCGGNGSSGGFISPKYNTKLRK